ncbi:MAG: M15 family metallopeptidase [Clostridiales bacterium]|nr:M15 family metallopeptidase [Clostridiales bacterium]
MRKRLTRALSGLLTAGLALSCLPAASALTSVSGWAQGDVSAAGAAGLIPDSFAPLPAKEPITRAEFCAVALQLYETARETTVKRTKKVYFDDCADPAVNTACEMKLVSGRADGFDPDEPVTRQDLCVILDGVRNACGADEPDEAASADNFPDSGSLRSYAVDAVETMLAAGVIRGVDVSLSSDPEADGRRITVLSPQGTATREQALIMAGRFLDAFEIEPEPEPAPAPAPAPDESDSHLTDLIDGLPPINLLMADPVPVAGEKNEKLVEVFGESAARYTEREEAEAHMVEITVPVWTLTAGGEKKASTRTITVHEALADKLEAVFQEIFEGDEQFPIKDVGGYAWRSNARSEHRQGTAIDINYDENMECSIDADGSVTRITCGSYWKPGEDPYSIPAGGDVVRAFAKYGFAWGGDAWTSKRDYMHFSYFGT